VKCVAFLAAVVLLALRCVGQASDPASSEAKQTLTPTVTFTLDWPGAEPEHYVITIDSSGQGTYESKGRPSAQREEPYSLKFRASETTRQRIFDLARALNYFNGDFDYKKGKIAFTGRKVLAYMDSSRHFETSYNWAENSSMRQLTELMQAIGVTLEFGRSLEYLHRYDRLGLNAELQRMDELASRGQLAELQVLTPQLEQIAEDSNVMEIARQKARKLLQRSLAKTQAAHAEPSAQQ
jgi:hypothetical protein